MCVKTSVHTGNGWDSVGAVSVFKSCVEERCENGGVRMWRDKDGVVVTTPSSVWVSLWCVGGGDDRM